MKPAKTVKVTATNIVWDTDGKKVSLPKTVTFVGVERGRLNDDPDYIADLLSDRYGWCVSSLTLNVG